MRLDELDYDLPEDRIASEPVEPRDAARLLVVGARIEDRIVRDLPSLLPPSLIVVNDTRVLRARLFGVRPSGGKVELLLVEPVGGTPAAEWLALARSSRPLRAGDTVLVDGETVEVIAKAEDGMVRVRSSVPAEALMARVGHLPLPPYIERDDRASDAVDYQTMFARDDGAVAAPTAGLHFTPALRSALEASGSRFASVTLHVGPGTFRPVKVNDLDEHPMHEERFHVSEETVQAIASARKEGRPVVAVGTTVVRTLEAAASGGSLVPGPGRTRLLIQPGHRFQVVDALLTNFHLPRSTLLALVMAFAGREPTRAAYAHAVACGYRFFSYGDAMLIPPGARA